MKKDENEKKGIKTNGKIIKITENCKRMDKNNNQHGRTKRDLRRRCGRGTVCNVPNAVVECRCQGRGVMRNGGGGGNVTRREKRYRTKIIQERHFRKINQIWLDEYVKDNMITYKAFYEAKLQPPPINAIIQAGADMTKMFKKVVFKGTKSLTKVWNVFAEVISGVCEGFYEGFFDKE